MFESNERIHELIVVLLIAYLLLIVLNMLLCVLLDVTARSYLDVIHPIESSL
jgi:hypothetical protein